MSWVLANPNGILATGSTQDTFGVEPPQFNAGTINGLVNFDAQVGLLTAPAITLVSTPTSGVWKLNDPNKGTWTPLSLAWPRPDMTCIVKGRPNTFDVFAAGGGIDGQGTLWESNDSTGTFGSWNSIDLSLLQTGTVNSVTIISPSGLNILVLACDNGIWWSILPATQNGVFSFKKAVTLQVVVDRWSSVALGNGKYPDSPLWAAPWGKGIAQPPLFRGFFSTEPNQVASELQLEAVDLPFSGGSTPAVFRVLISASPTDESKRFLIGGGVDGSIGFVFRSINVSSSAWEEAGTTVTGVADALKKSSVTGLLGDWAGAVTFSELDADTLAIGWQSAYFLSTDYGSTWTQIDASNSPNIHSGIHAIQFTNEDAFKQKSLAIATDGGLFTTNDGGQTHISTANQTFPNLKFSNGALDNHSIGIVTGSLSNDLNLYGSVYGVPQLWQPLRNNDIGPVAFLRNGLLLDYDNLQSTNSISVQSVLQGRRLDPFNRPHGYSALLDPVLFNDAVTAPGSGGNIDMSMNLRPLEPVDVPSSVDINSSSLVAVAGRQFEVCGVILSRQDSQNENVAVSVLGSPTASEVITAVASSDGQSIIVGTDQGNLFLGAPVPGSSSNFSFNFNPMPITTPPPTFTQPITKISARKGNRIFAIAKGIQLLRLEGSGWSHIPHPHVLEEFTALLAVPSDSSLFISTPSRIFQSTDDGNTWINISAGLPTFPHITDLQHIKEPGGASILYVFTDGWSVFKRILNQPTIPIQRAVTVKSIMGITYKENTMNFNVSDGSMVGFNQGVEVFRFVNANGNVFVDMTIRATFREDESVEVVSGLWLNNFWSGKGGKTPGTTVVLDAGRSYYQNVNVKVGGGRGDKDGGIVDFDFLVTN